MQNIKLLSIVISTTISFVISVVETAHADSAYETELLYAVEQMMSPTHVITTDILNQFIEVYPESRAGYIMMADLLAAKAGLSISLGKNMSHVDRDIVTDLRNQLRIRWSYRNAIEPARKNLTPSSLLQLRADHDLILFMDIPSSRLIVYKRSGNTLLNVDSFYASIGIKGFGKSLEGDQKTPVGIYRITGFIPGNNLHEKYGPGALPLDYPNQYDRLHRYTGDGIWIHGTEPGYVNRAPLASDGCISLANTDFKKLHSYIGRSIPTSIVIDSNPNWISINELSYLRSRVLHPIKEWFKAVSRNDQETYFNFYDMSYAGSSLSSARNSRKILADFPINITLNLLKSSLFLYPGTEDLYVADLQLIDSQKNSFVVRQYWIERPEKTWKIVAQLRTSE